MTAISNIKKISKAQEKAKALRDSFWPDLDESRLWNRKTSNGFTTVPRTMPLIMNIIDALSKNKPAGRTYFALWCRSFDQSFLVIDNPMTLAAEAGFTGERAVSTWKERMRTLVELGFIDARKGTTGDFHYVLLLNPHQVAGQLRDRIQDGMFLQLQTRVIEIGANDIATPAPPPSDSDQ